MKTAKTLVLDGNARSANRGRWGGHTVAERFWSHVDTSGECWIWTARRNAKGYGCFGLSGGKNTLAHRASWVLHNGPLAAHVLVLHSLACTSRACVRPEHLRTGTQKENVTDSQLAGRHVSVTKNPNTPKGNRQWMRRDAHLVVRDTRGRVIARVSP